MKPTVSVVIINYKAPKSLKKLLSQLKENNDLEVIVIDNSEINRGFARACNLGALKASGDWLLFLNPDVEINPKQIQKMVEYAIEHKLDAASPQTNDKNYIKPIPSWLSLLVEFSPLNRLIPLSIFRSKTLTGGLLLIKSSVLRSLGGLDERFFLWFEDSDLTKRLINNGYMVGWLDGLDIQHEGGESFKTLDEQYKHDVFFNSMYVYAIKHFNFFGKLIVKLIKKRFTKRKVLPKIFDGVSIIVPNMRIEILQEFLTKNAKLITKNYEWIIATSSVDSNGIWSFRRKYPEIRFIIIDKNRGFASTVNIGFQVATGKWIGTVNDDTVLNNNWLDECLKCENDNVGSLNPIIYKPNGELESAGVEILAKGKAVTIKSPPQHCQEADAINAAAAIYSKEALNKVGLFDERFGSYLEDIDLSLRLKRSGFKNIVVPHASVIHEGHRTAKFLGVKKQFLDFRNWIYVIAKNWSVSDLLLNFPLIILERAKNLSGLFKALFR